MIEYHLGWGAIVAVLAHINPGNEALFIHDKDRRCSPPVVEQVINPIKTADGVIGIGQNGINIIIAIDQGLHFILRFNYQGNDLGTLFFKL